MKFTRNLITLLALTSVTAAIAGDNRWFAGKYRPAATASAPQSTASQDTKNGEKCECCEKTGKKMVPPKVRETGPAEKDLSGPEYQNP